MLHVLVGEKGSMSELPSAHENGSPVKWTIPKGAFVDDSVALFVGKSFVGMGNVLTKPIPGPFGRRPAYESDIGVVTLFHNPVPLEPVASAIPAWAWTRYPRSYTTVPRQFEGSLQSILEQFSRADAALPERSTPQVMAQEALDGALYEARFLSRRRSRALRLVALDRANGICEACGIDFSLVLGGLGLKVLQVHHRNQLSAARVPKVTVVDELAVLCANCHAIVHADSSNAMPVVVLRDRFRTERRAAANTGVAADRRRR